MPIIKRRYVISGLFLIFCLIRHELFALPPIGQIIRLIFGLTMPLWLIFTLLTMILFIIPIVFFSITLIYFKPTIFNHAKPISRSFKLATSLLLKSYVILVFTESIEFISRVVQSRAYYILFRLNPYEYENYVGIIELYIITTSFIIHALNYMTAFFIVELFIYYSKGAFRRNIADFLKHHTFYLIGSFTLLNLYVILLIIADYCLRIKINDMFEHVGSILNRSFPGIIVATVFMIVYNSASQEPNLDLDAVAL